MGRANSRKRKGTGHQHLPKVGSKPELTHDGRRERAAIMDVMGMGNLGPGVRSALFTIGVLILVAAIVALVLFSI